MSTHISKHTNARLENAPHALESIRTNDHRPVLVEELNRPRHKIEGLRRNCPAAKQVEVHVCDSTSLGRQQSMRAHYITITSSAAEDNVRPTEQRLSQVSLVEDERRSNEVIGSRQGAPRKHHLSLLARTIKSKSRKLWARSFRSKGEAGA